MAPATGAAPACTAGRGPSSAHDIGALFRRHGQQYRARTRSAPSSVERCATSPSAEPGRSGATATCAPAAATSTWSSTPAAIAIVPSARRCARRAGLKPACAEPCRCDTSTSCSPCRRELRPLVREHTVALLDLLFAAAAETILTLARDPEASRGPGRCDRRRTHLGPQPVVPSPPPLHRHGRRLARRRRLGRLGRALPPAGQGAEQTLSRKISRRPPATIRRGQARAWAAQQGPALPPKGLVPARSIQPAHHVRPAPAIGIAPPTIGCTSRLFAHALAAPDHSRTRGLAQHDV